jgi:RNA polymerase sigma-54 factor
MVKEEIEKNPALEGLTEKNELPSGDLNSQSEDYDPFENSSDPGYRPPPQTSRFSGDEDSKRKFLEGAVSRGISLHEHLIEQIHLQRISERELEIAEKIIYNLDANGFHKEDPLLLIDRGEEALLDKLLVKLQHLDPPGCAAQDFIESLQIQASLRENTPSMTYEFIKDQLSGYRDSKKDKISKELGISMDQLQGILVFLKTLTPFPGRLYSSEPTHFIIPDLSIRLEEGEFRIFLNDSQIPELKIDDYFDELSQDKSMAKDARSFANSHVKDARWFINSIEQRNKTLLKTAHAIVQFQREFFRSGPRYLAPLTLKDVASEIGVHEATVSRITTNKYVQTEWGILELKYFFTNSISGAGSGGSSYSKEAVKLIIKEIIEEYSGEKRLSDQKISDVLSQRGISLARRTVTKYRKELDIDSSFHR